MNGSNASSPPPDAGVAAPATVRTTRRQALGRLAAASAAVGGFPTIVASSALGLDGAVPPSERITLGVVGIGPRCTYVLTSMLGLADVRCLAIADVQAARREKGKALVDKQHGNDDCRLYRDFRELLARKDIDTVIVATGDRWHAPASILAAEAGKDVYCEKPCGLTIRDCQEIDKAFTRTRRIFQAGTQRRSVPLVQYAVKLAHDGALGKLRTLHASVYEPKLENAWLPAEPTPAADVCDWNLWLGPAPWRPYNAQYVAGKWRGPPIARRLPCRGILLDPRPPAHDRSRHRDLRERRRGQRPPRAAGPRLAVLTPRPGGRAQHAAVSCARLASLSAARNSGSPCQATRRVTAPVSAAASSTSRPRAA